MIGATLRRGDGRPRILLKARPTDAQLAERLNPPRPDGVELYIHEQDVSGDGWLERLTRRFRSVAATDDFLWVVEGPVWSLDGELFGLWRDAPADRDLIHRLVRLAEAIGARALNIHCVEGSEDLGVLNATSPQEAVARAVPFLTWFVTVCQGSGLIPLIENVPPICRMRRAAFIYTPLGVEPSDLAACAQAVPGLGLTLDTSHAQLAVNAFCGAHSVEGQPLTDDDRMAVARAASWYHQLGGPQTLGEYIEDLLPWVVGAHVSNAQGVLAEGLPYEQGDADLDAAVRQLAPHAAYLVTEPIDVDEDHPALKRGMQAHLARVLSTLREAV